MRILGVTQGSSLQVFLQLGKLLAPSGSGNATAAYVADSRTFKSMTRRDPSLIDSMPLLREWDITAVGARRKVDWQLLRELEEVYGDPVLWNVLLADRRLFFGKLCKYRQDYKPRFSHQELGGIVLEAIEKISAFVDRFKPDVILSFGTATFGDYIFYRLAKAKGIPYLLLKSTKLGNFVSLNDDAVELSSHIAAFYARPSTIPEHAILEADAQIERIRAHGVKYEGAIKRSAQFRPLKGLVAIVRGIRRDFLSALDPEIRRDNHVDPAVVHAWYSFFGQPLKASIVRRRLQRSWIDTHQLDTVRDFAFFPLHFEPEVSIQVFGRPYQNQIELVRNLARSLPAGMLLLVKEHPRSVGVRPYGYYKKLLQIPNVKLVDPDLPTHVLIRQAALVGVISGSSGLEAAILGKPVLVFGTPAYNQLPQSIVRYASDQNELSKTILDLLRTYRPDEQALQRFLAAHIAGSTAVDLYSLLLGKPDRHFEGREDVALAQRLSQDFQKLANYCKARISAEDARRAHL